jgi:hypothetical protein
VKAPAKGITAYLQLQGARMNYLEAQQELAETIKNAAMKVNPYFWQLSGDKPNSLCRFLGIGEEELKKSLRLCKIYNGPKDQFSKNNFEMTTITASRKEQRSLLSSASRSTCWRHLVIQVARVHRTSEESTAKAFVISTHRESSYPFSTVQWVSLTRYWSHLNIG